MFIESWRPRRIPRFAFAAAAGVALLVAAVLVLAPRAGAGSHSSAATVNSKTFKLFPNPAFRSCLQASGQTAAASATVTRGSLNDKMVLSLSGFKSGLDFDLFTVQRSNQTASGAPVSGFTNFGMAWYQSDIHTSSSGTASVTIKTILLDQIFGFDPDVNLAPTQTLHVGFWFNSITPAQPCSTTTLTPTPFNGEHNAGPLAFITRPNATTDLGPLCTQSVETNGTFHCKP